MNLALKRNSMQTHLSVITHKPASFTLITRAGTCSGKQNLDPVVKQYAKKYLVQEGFLEQALGVLDPAPSESDDLFR